VVDALHEVEGLVAFEGRGPGTDAERRAGRPISWGAWRTWDGARRRKSSRVFPNYALTHLIHALLAVVGSVVSVSAPLVGTLLVLVAAISAALDLTGTFFLVAPPHRRPRLAERDLARPHGPAGHA